MYLDRAIHALGIIVTLSVSTACQKSHHLSNDIELPVSSEQQAVAVEATRRLRDQWNRGACEVLYEQAAVEFRSRPLPDWLLYCEYERRKLGVWQSFVSQDAFIYGRQASVLFLEGRAAFGKESYDAIIAWMMENRHPRFLYLSLGQNGNAVGTLPPPQKHLLLDPPPASNTKRNS